MRRFVPFILMLLLLSCGRDSTRQTTGYGLQITPTKGSWQNPDSFAKPVTVPAGQPTVLRPVKSTAKANSHHTTITNLPKGVPAGEPSVCVLGKDSFLFPETFQAVPQVKPVGMPEVVVAKDMGHKDQNPGNFSFYKAFHGLKHIAIFCMTQDKGGNLWFGSADGGVARYDGKSFTHFTTKQGLGSNTVYSVLQDRTGKLWLGTGHGISYYDGKNFVSFKDTHGLSDAVGVSAFQDRQGNLWLGTEGKGVFCFDGTTFTQFTRKQGLLNDQVWYIIQDKAGRLWFGTNEGVSCYDGKSFTNYTEKQGLINNCVLSLLEDNTGKFWFGTAAGVSCFNGHTFINLNEKNGFAGGAVTSIVQDAQGMLWFGPYGNGLFRFDGRNFINFTNKDGLSGTAVMSILEDRSRNLWVGFLDGGIVRYDGRTFTNFTETDGLAGATALSLLSDAKGNLWFGTQNGLTRYDGENFTNFNHQEGELKNLTLCALQDRSGKFWFGTEGGLLAYDGQTFSNFADKQGLGSNVVMSALQDKAGHLWLGHTSGGVSRFDGKTFTRFSTEQGLAGDHVNCILEDKGGTTWFATHGGGLSAYAANSFTNFTEKEGLASNVVYALLQDKSGVLWIGTDGGVSRYDGTHLVNFTEKEGLANNAVLSLVEDNQGNIWFGTRKGLSKITPRRLASLSAFLHRAEGQQATPSESNPGEPFDALQEGLFYNYDYHDGFLGVNCRRNAVVKDNQGRIWWGADMLTCYTPEGDRADTTAPVVQLNSVKLFGEEIAWASIGNITTDSSGRETAHGRSRDTLLGNGVLLHDIRFDSLARWYPLPHHLSLPYNNNNLTFNFIGVHMQSRNHVRYQYQLLGLEDNWSVITDRNEAHYGNLPPGHYTFRVKAMNQSGVWSAPFQFSFEVRPPWWQSWWFRCTVVACTVVCVWAYIKWRERELTERQRELEASVNEATLEIKEQKQALEERHKEITDSINYAERIQRSFLATQQHLDQHLSEYFVFFRPKEVVSGDFYWSATLNNGHFAIVCADSTGHGVPGAIMSLLNVTSLERAIERETEPHKILDATRKIIIERLTNDGSAEGGRDGMDGSLLSFDFKNNVLYCAAANNPVCIIRNNQLIEIKSDRIPIGKHERDQEPFTLHTLQLQKGDLVYAFTDGFSDQFGGPAGKKFKYKKLLKLLLSMANESMAVQKQKLTDVFNDWKGTFEQVDDVTVIGMRV